MSSLVYVKNPNGKTYVYSNISVYDKETKKVKHIRKSIGHLDPVTGEVIPNRRKGDIARKKAETKDSSTQTSLFPHIRVQDKRLEMI